jgi:hypothetical protein
VCERQAVDLVRDVATLASAAVADSAAAVLTSLSEQTNGTSSKALSAAANALSAAAPDETPTRLDVTQRARNVSAALVDAYNGRVAPAARSAPCVHISKRRCARGAAAVSHGCWYCVHGCCCDACG